MEIDGWPDGLCDGTGRSLARLRNRASSFFESLSVAELVCGTRRRTRIADWLKVADGYRTQAASARDEGSLQAAAEAWLCSLTALEVVRSLSCAGDLESVDLAEEVRISLTGFQDDAGPAIERVTIDCFGQGTLTGFFLPTPPRQPSPPVLVCVSDEEITLGSMMSRLLPASRFQSVSLLLVDAGVPSARHSFKPEHVLQCWLDYLEARPDVGQQRIAIYGEGAGAIHASRVALSDRRIAAAVCDGGLLSPVMRRASLRWMTRSGQAAEHGTAAAPPLQLRRIPCPLLMAVGSRSMIWEQDALELQAGYRQAGAACFVVVPNRIPHPLGEVENFVAVDDFILEWLCSSPGAVRQIEPVTYL